MNKEIGGEDVKAVVVACPRCGKLNRLQRQAHEVSYRCGNRDCREILVNPIKWRPPHQSHRKNRIYKLLYIAAVVGVAGILIIALTLTNAKTPSLPASAPSPAMPTQRAQLPIEQNRPQLPAPVIIAKPLMPPRFLQNGTILKKLSQYGLGKFTVDNGTAQDAVIKLIDKDRDRAIVAFYLRAGHAATISRVPDGEYKTVFASGVDWDSESKNFTRNKSFSVFNRTFKFVTVREINENQEQISAHSISITLHSVPSGNVSLKKISEQSFLQY